MSVAQFEVVEQAKDPTAATGRISLFDADGIPVSPGGSTPPTADTLQGVTAVGRKVLKAADEATARIAIGAGTPYSLPTATTGAIGGVKKAAAVSTAATDADAAAIVTTLNDLITKLKTAGIIS